MEGLVQGVCLDLSYWSDLLDVAPNQSCRGTTGWQPPAGLCQPAAVFAVGSLAEEAEDWVIKALVGLALMIPA